MAVVSASIVVMPVIEVKLLPALKPVISVEPNEEGYAETTERSKDTLVKKAIIFLRCERFTDKKVGHWTGCRERGRE